MVCMLVMTERLAEVADWLELLFGQTSMSSRNCVLDWVWISQCEGAWGMYLTPLRQWLHQSSCLLDISNSMQQGCHTAVMQVVDTNPVATCYN